MWKTVGVTVVETRTIKHTLEEAKRELESRLDPDSRWGILMAELVREVEQCHNSSCILIWKNTPEMKQSVFKTKGLDDE